MLSPKQEQFCIEYLIDLNATQAAIRAGYAKRSAKEQASRLLTNDNIASRVRELMNERAQRTEITADFVLTGLKEVAERCLQAVPVIEWDYAEKQFVQKKDDQGKGVFEFDSTGANRAFELLGKHVGIFEKDNRQKTPEPQNWLNEDQFNKLLNTVRETSSSKGK
jgi:phage terminase small subunit